MEQNLADFIVLQRFDTTLMATFAALGLALASVGILGVMSHRVAQRRMRSEYECISRAARLDPMAALRDE